MNRRLNVERKFWKGTSTTTKMRSTLNYKVVYAEDDDHTFLFLVGNRRLSMSFPSDYPFSAPTSVTVNGVPYSRILNYIEHRLPWPQKCMCCKYSILFGQLGAPPRWSPVHNTIDAVNEIEGTIRLSRDLQISRVLFSMLNQRLGGAYVPIDLYLFTHERLLYHYHERFY